MNKSPCCPKCFQSIAHLNTRAAKLWVDMCEYVSFTGNNIVLKDKYCGEDLIDLEKFGYIISTDDETRIIVKLNGLTQDENEEDLYCLEVEQHA
jgi:hypothetical protein